MSDEEFIRLGGVIEEISDDEWQKIYVPLLKNTFGKSDNEIAAIKHKRYQFIGDLDYDTNSLGVLG